MRTLQNILYVLHNLVLAQYYEIDNTVVPQYGKGLFSAPLQISKSTDAQDHLYNGQWAFHIYGCRTC